MTVEVNAPNGYLSFFRTTELPQAGIPEEWEMSFVAGSLSVMTATT